MLLARAYAELSSCKPLGPMGRGPIPWTAMIEWARFHHLEHDVTRHMIVTVRNVDGLFMEREATTAKNKTPSSPPRRR